MWGIKDEKKGKTRFGVWFHDVMCDDVLCIFIKNKIKWFSEWIFLFNDSRQDVDSLNCKKLIITNKKNKNSDQ